jgi:hypothetical protein
MTRDDMRKLVGGYATGTLTESERKLLFEAALDDQELFDELAREQSLKEMLDEPGAKQRLVSKLAQPKPEPAWWRRYFAWPAAALLATATAALTIVWLRPVSQKTSQPVEIAETRAVTPAVAPPAAEPAPARPAPSAPAARAPAPRRPEKPAHALSDASEPATANAPVKQNAEKKEPGRRENDSTENLRGQNAEAEQKDKKVEEQASAGLQTAASAPPPRAATQSEVQVQAQASGPLQTAPVQVQSFQPGTAFGVGGAVPRAGAAAKGKLVARASFGFTYSIDADRGLVIRATSAGYLSVAAAGSQTSLFPSAGDGHVVIGSTTRIPMPAGVKSVVITFAAAAANSPLAKTAPADAISSVRDASAGAVEDPNPTPNSKLILELRIQP